MNRIAILALLSALCIFLSACAIKSDSPGAYSVTLIWEGKHTYGQGVRLPGTVIIVNGELHLENGSQTAGPVYLLGGLLDIQGQVDGDVSTIGGQLTAGSQAHIKGDLRLGSGNAHLAPEAVISGQVQNSSVKGVELQDLPTGRSLQNRMIWLLPEALILAGLAYLAERFAPRPVARVSRAATGHPIVCLALGLLASVVGLVLLVVMAFTLILIPVTIFGFVIGFLAISFGWSGIGAVIGRWINENWTHRLSPGGTAFWGTFLFILLLDLVNLLPVVGALIYLFLVVLSFGAVLLTRFGIQDFIPYDPTAG